jgi:hypothetical protein
MLDLQSPNSFNVSKVFLACKVQYQSGKSENMSNEKLTRKANQPMALQFQIRVNVIFFRFIMGNHRQDYLILISQ